MVSTSKILTVSYGTFSCTLEGFDNSFDTMKAIAEYFRDLAADDRYFGAEPPTPDAEMLARIAEREIARRVEAHASDGRIHLRAGPAPALAAATQSGDGRARPAMSSARDMAEAPRALADDPDASLPADPRDAPGEDRAEDGATPAEVPPQAARPAADGDSVADKLRRIRAVASPAQPSGATAALDSSYGADETYAEDGDAFYGDDDNALDFLTETAADLDAALAEDDAEDATAPVSEAAPDTTASDPDDALQADDADTPADPVAEDPAPSETMGTTDIAASDQDDAPDADAPETAPAEAEDTTDTAASEQDAAMPDAGDTPDAAGDVAAQVAPTAEMMPVMPQPDVPNASADSGVADAMSTPDAPQPQAQETDAPMDGDTADDEADQDMLARLGADDAADTLTVDADEDPAPGEDEDEDDALASLLDAVSAQDDTEEDDHDDEDLDDDQSGDDLNGDLSDDTLSQLLADALGNDAAPAPQPTAPEAEARPEAGPLRARVVKMKRADLDAALAGGAIEEDDSDAPESSLSPQAEAELQRELAEVEAELRQARAAHRPDTAPAASEMPGDATASEDTGAPDTAGDPAPTAASAPLDRADDTDMDTGADADQDTPAPAASSRRAVRLDTIGTDTQVPRMFDKADSQLEDPEANKRRNAIQHLRAAVAATKAEQSAGGAMSRDVDDHPYRMDLESAVRPRRPATAGTPRADRPAATRPAPLKLVAEQRIDAPVQPVRPRRITRADLESRPRPAARSGPPAETAERAAPAGPAPVPTRVAPTAAPTAATAQTARKGDQGSFTDFAEAKGVRGLTDLLEAAAAYMSDVEGMEQFSRPMLMQKLREVDDTGFSREEGLRSFGQLLRQGKLQKLKGGRFAVTDETEFRQSA